jgi:hypothetical protein
MSGQQANTLTKEMTSVPASVPGAGTELVMHAEPVGPVQWDGDRLPPVRPAAPSAPRADGYPLRKLFLIGATVFALAGAAYFGWEHWTVARFQVSTDDAYVKADNTTIAPKVSGYIAARRGQSVGQGGTNPCENRRSRFPGGARRDPGDRSDRSTICAEAEGRAGSRCSLKSIASRREKAHTTSSSWTMPGRAPDLADPHRPAPVPGGGLGPRSGRPDRARDSHDAAAPPGRKGLTRRLSGRRCWLVFNRVAGF